MKNGPLSTQTRSEAMVRSIPMIFSILRYFLEYIITNPPPTQVVFLPLLLLTNKQSQQVTTSIIFHFILRTQFSFVHHSLLVKTPFANGRRVWLAGGYSEHITINESVWYDLSTMRIRYGPTDAYLNTIDLRTYNHDVLDC